MGVALAIGAVAFIIAYALVKPAVVKAASNLANRRKSVSDLFTIPLICAAALLSFAHGANDVANAIAPLATIYAIYNANTFEKKSNGRAVLKHKHHLDLDYI